MSSRTAVSSLPSTSRLDHTGMALRVSAVRVSVSAVSNSPCAFLSFMSSANHAIGLWRGVDLKLYRAKQHLNDLMNLVARVAARGEFYDITRHPVEDARREMFRFDVRKPIPDDVPLILGDLLHNCRSALDHMIHALWLKNRRKVTSRELRLLGFPIAASLSEFNPAEKVGGVSAEAFAVIQRVQPYNRSRPGRDPLARLRELSNADKHRNLNLAFWQFQSVGWMGEPDGKWEFVTADRRLEDGTEIAAFCWRSEPNPNIDFVFSCEVVISEGPQPFNRVGIVAGKICKAVCDVRDSLEPLLS